MYLGILATVSLILMTVLVILQVIEIEHINDKLDDILESIDKEV